MSDETKKSALQRAAETIHKNLLDDLTAAEGEGAKAPSEDLFRKDEGTPKTIVVIHGSVLRPGAAPRADAGPAKVTPVADVTTEHGDRSQCEWCNGNGSNIFDPRMPCPMCGHAATFHETDGRCPSE